MQTGLSEGQLESANLDCKLVVTFKMQSRNATEKLNQQWSKFALFAITNVVG